MRPGVEGLAIRDAALESCLRAVRTTVGDRGRRNALSRRSAGMAIALWRTWQTSRSGTETPLPPASPAGASGPPLHTTSLGARRATLRGLPATSNPEDATFCAACGTRLRQLCAHCGQDILLPAAFCTACGQPLIVRPSRAWPHWPRRPRLHSLADAS